MLPHLVYDKTPVLQSELNKTGIVHEASESLCKTEPREILKDDKCSIKDSQETYNNGAYTFLAITAALMGRYIE